MKSRNGQVGRGAGVAVIRDGRPPADEAFAGAWVIQDLVTGDGRDRKLYVAGGQARGLLKAGTAATEAFVPSEDLASLASRAGAALGLDLYGVDLVVGPHGPRVIDVNPFPGFRGISDAVELVASLLLPMARDQAETLRRRPWSNCLNPMQCDS